MSCWIRGCSTKGGKNDASRKRSLFTAHTEEMFNNWSENGIATRGINEFSKKSRICELHFKKDDILKEDTFQMVDGTTITVQRKIPKLKEDAVPSIFPSKILSKIAYYRFNPIYEEKREEQQNEETSGQRVEIRNYPALQTATVHEELFSSADSPSTREHEVRLHFLLKCYQV